ncbi:cingulin [Anabrus simplex]|uniref:cingulin n=1 Tax=Anabrus simplex TaxID=316456 RepID=UPI0034DDB5AC
MSANHAKRPITPRMTSGCGDGSTEQLGLERKQFFGACGRKLDTKRRDAPKFTAPSLKRAETFSKFTLPNSSWNGKTQYKKASSLEDLTPKRVEYTKRRKLPSPVPMKELQNDDEDDSGKGEINVAQAARRVYQALILNAWRRKRQDSQEQIKTIAQLGTQVDNLNIQTIVLKRLLESEKTRVTRAAEEVQKMVAQMEESFRERDAAKAEKDAVEREVCRLENCVLEANTRCQNLKNDYLTARSEVTSLENQMSKERDKLAKLREDKKYLIEKVKAMEEGASLKAATVERLQGIITDLKSQLQTQEQVNDAAQSANMALKQLEKEQAKLADDLTEMQNQSEALKVRVQTLEDQLMEKEKQKQILKKTISEQRVELERLRSQIAEFTEMQNTWSARAFRLMSSLARYPLTFFSNLALVLMPFPPPAQ